MKVQVTVFTPAYNRGHLLTRLYESLCRQTVGDFEWVVVDDGSSDNTGYLMGKFQAEKNLDIRYFYQSNGGKHRAINLGVQQARGELFFIVDNDDLLCDNAIERVVCRYNEIKGDDSFAGVCGLKVFSDGTKVGGGCDFGVIDCSSIEFRNRYNIKGDMAEVFRTDVLKKFPFPEFENEKFCPEAIVWNRIAQQYRFRYFYEKIYICEYLPDGLTAHIINIRMLSPQASMLCYKEMSELQIPLNKKIRSAINYWRFSLCSNLPFQEKVKGMSKWMWLFGAGVLLHLKDKRQNG